MMRYNYRESWMLLKSTFRYEKSSFFYYYGVDIDDDKSCGGIVFYSILFKDS